MRPKQLTLYLDLWLSLYLYLSILSLNPLGLYADIGSGLLLCLNASILSGHNISLFVSIPIILEFHLHFITGDLLLDRPLLQLLDSPLHFIANLFLLAEFLLELDQSRLAFRELPAYLGEFLSQLVVFGLAGLVDLDKFSNFEFFFWTEIGEHHFPGLRIIERDGLLLVLLQVLAFEDSLSAVLVVALPVHHRIS